MSEPSTAPTGDTAAELPHCKCGTDRRSKYAVVDRDYTFLGMVYLIWGGTSVPSKVTFRCVKCGQVFESTTRTSVCREHTT